MKKYKVFKLTSMWSTDTLTKEVEQFLNEKASDGYEIVSVAFGVNMWSIPTAFITVCK